MFLLLAAVLFQFQPVDSGLPRSGQWRHGSAVADMNGDGRADLVFTIPRKQLGPPVIFLNEGNGQWRRWSEATFPDLSFDYGSVAAADFDGDGAMDLAVASHYRGVTVVRGDGHGNFIAAGEGMGFPQTWRESAPFSSRAVVTLDWNRDGKPDVAALSDGPRPGVPGVQLGVTVYQNLGNAWMPLRMQVRDADGNAIRDAIYGDALAVGDVDGDGFPDLVTASSLTGDARILRLGSDPALAPRTVVTTMPVRTVRGVATGDFDGDARDEIVLGYRAATDPATGSIEIASFAAGVPPRRLWSEEGATVAAVAAGDLNGDGALDVVAALSDGRLLTFRGDGAGFVTRDADLAVSPWRTNCAPYGLRLDDLDADGRDEIIANFAGDGGGCVSGGGVEAWSVRDLSMRRRAVRNQ